MEEYKIDQVSCEYLDQDIYRISLTLNGVKWVETVTVPGVEAVLHAQNLKPQVRALYEAAADAIEKHNKPEPVKVESEPEEKPKKKKGQGDYGIKKDFDE